MAFTNSTKGGFSFTKVVHHTPYPAISPSRPELSQVGKTVLITGGSSGIGLAAARAFAQARAERVIIVGRRVELLDRAVSQLKTDNPKVQIRGQVCDVGDAGSVERLWTMLEKEGVFVDVVVLSAARFAGLNPIATSGLDVIWDDYTTNVRGHVDFAQRLYKQPNPTRRGTALVNVSTKAIYDYSSDGLANLIPLYSASKSAAAMLLQMLAKDVDPDEMQVVSFHPGGVFTEAVSSYGFYEDDFDWDDANMPGQFAVWAASPEARFLHGRFVWAGWDVQELQQGPLRKRIEEDQYFLKVGIAGLREWERARVLSEET
ncbi:short chain dehydrogenase [Hirsutella rhossiliensis]|uniref:Short chain dehydrogenase domain-containing protein n=1 Tax=Hirsutella rhossiliensis TaxID=111463 RepID=A0A9P8SDQ5_9HYPO|nr:short chain dehydrogenase domain-containing protein [Hirsutella rhossiliensis]KAH0958998.1 short chain dehydrogenase domain-containing protein [Hirsutella rhossiliensis]